MWAAVPRRTLGCPPSLDSVRRRRLFSRCSARGCARAVTHRGSRSATDRADTRDLPAGFVQALGATPTNAAIARENGLSVKVYNSLGRVIGYEVAYRAASGRTTSVDVQVVRYRSTAGATQAFVLGQQMVAGAYANNHAFHAMLDSAGDTAVQSFLRTVAKQRQQVFSSPRTPGST